jgi:hypothetical protein
MADSQFVYVLAGKVLPERAAVSVPRLSYKVSSGADVPLSDLELEIQLSQIYARLICPSPLQNIFTARNIVLDIARSTLDVVGFLGARAFDVEITHFIPADGSPPTTFDYSVPALNEVLSTCELTHDSLLRLSWTPNGWYIARSMGDFRLAMLSAMDTGFYCYRAIETLMHFHAASTANVLDQKEAKQWEAFREHHGISKEDIFWIKKFADPIRHGNGASLDEITDGNRAEIFKRAMRIAIAVYRRACADLGLTSTSNPS